MAPQYQHAFSGQRPDTIRVEVRRGFETIERQWTSRDTNTKAHNAQAGSLPNNLAQPLQLDDDERRTNNCLLTALGRWYVFSRACACAVCD